MLKIWDGKSKSRQKHRYAAPDATDWERIVKEVIKTQKVIIENSNIYSNKADEVILVGQPLILESNIQIADLLNPEVIGLSINSCGPNENCIYITQGQLSLENWFHITGTNELIPGAYYYLSSKGELTAIPPSSIVVSELGRAQNKYVLNINIKTPIYL